MIRRSCWSLPCLLIGLMLVAGCSKKVAVGKPHTHHPEAEVTLCGLCGEVKGSEKCCKDGATLCPICGLHKGSPLCCSTAIYGRRDVLLCRKCGEKAFTDKCCKEGIALCPKCGLHKGSPGCCKIEPVAKDGGTGGEFTHTHEGHGDDHDHDHDHDDGHHA